MITGLRKALLMAIVGALFSSAALTAGTYTINTNDSIDITLDNGDQNGMPGSTVGWGFDVTWTSLSGDWLQFSSTNLAAQTGPSAEASYTDTIGSQGGPVQYQVSPNPNYPYQSTWQQSWVQGASGVGDYQIAAGATGGSADSGEIVFTFSVFDDNYYNGGQLVGNPTYSVSLPYTVTVDAAPVTGTPEPGTSILCLSALAGLGLSRRLRPGQ